MSEELRKAPPPPPASVEPGPGPVPAPALPVSDELRRAVEDAQSAVAEPSFGLGPPPQVADPVSKPGGRWSAGEAAFPAGYVEPRATPAVPPTAPVEVTTRPIGEWRIAVDPRSATTDDEVAIHGGLSESLALPELRAIPVGSAAPAAPAWRPWRRDRAVRLTEDSPGPAAAPLGEPLPPRAEARQRLTGRERRWVRRRRRVVFEEVLAWVLVPVILIACYWLLKFILAGLGTTPTALFENVKAAIQGFERR